MYGSGGNIAQAKECKRDLEEDAKGLKKRIDEFKALECAIKDFVHAGHIYWIEDQGDRRALFVLCGAFSIEIPALEGEYEKILEEIERGS